MDIHIRGLSCIDGKVAVVLDLISPDGTKQSMLMPTGYAHTLACTLIEFALIGRSNEAILKDRPGAILDPTAAVVAFGTRLEERMKLNDSTAAVTWGNGIVN
jgi:hypothetical protein